MFKLDEDILRCYLRLEEYERQEKWMERLLHPEKLKWVKKGAPPPITRTKKIRIEELGKMGFDEAYYQRMARGKKETMLELAELVVLHPLWPHFQRIKGFSYRLAGGFIAAGGDIQRAPTASAFWYGMGLDVLSDGTVPRRIRGVTNVERRVPALPHVTKVGELIRMQLLRTEGLGQELYYKHKADHRARHSGPLMFAHKHGMRIPQKILYACLWEQWRLAYGLPSPWPYAFAILNHDSGSRITISDFYNESEPVEKPKRKGASRKG